MRFTIWGNGRFGKMICNNLLQNGDHEIICIIDKKAENGTYIDESGITVVDLTKFEKEYLNQTDIVLIAIVQFESAIEHLKIWKNVVKWGIVRSRVLDQGSSLNTNLLADENIIWDRNFEPFLLPVLKHIQTNVVDACNLNCKGCSHFAQLFDCNSVYPFEKFDSDIKQIASKVFVLEFAMLGGEIFMLYDELEKYIRCIRTYMPYTSIIIYTNGILIPRQSDKLLKYLKENNVYVFVTEYLPAQKIRERIEETLNRYEIPHTISILKEQFGKNIDLHGENDPHIANSMCRQKTCQFMRGGRLYKCPFSALGNTFFDHYNIPLHFEEGIDIYDELIDWKYVSETIRTKPIEQCKYCGIEEQFEWAISNEPSAEEWLV